MVLSEPSCISLDDHALWAYDVSPLAWSGVAGFNGFGDFVSGLIELTEMDFYSVGFQPKLSVAPTANPYIIAVDSASTVIGLFGIEHFSETEPANSIFWQICIRLGVSCYGIGEDARVLVDGECLGVGENGFSDEEKETDEKREKYHFI